MVAIASGILASRPAVHFAVRDLVMGEGSDVVASETKNLQNQDAGWRSERRRESHARAREAEVITDRIASISHRPYTCVTTLLALQQTSMPLILLDALVNGARLHPEPLLPRVPKPARPLPGFVNHD